jgi:hypothetical protein
MSPRVDVSGSTADPAELRAALEQALGRHFSGQRSIARLEGRPSDYQSSFALEEVDVTLDGGTTLRLLFKDLSSRALLPGARDAKPAFLCEHRREIEVYETILARRRLGTATCYGSVLDERLGRYWLFLERVPGVELYRVGELSTWQQAARWLAGLHTGLAAECGRLAGAAHLLVYDGAFYRRWPQRAVAFVKAGHDRGRLEWLADRYEQVVERLAELPVTFLHGEFYASNVLVQHTADGLRVCPVDWEMAAVGPGLIDLAALTAGKWTEEARRELALAYHAELAPGGGGVMTAEAFLEALDCCRLHLAVQWLGWSPVWSPPPEHAQDWLREALTLAERLAW